MEKRMKRLGKWAALLLAGVLATSALAADKQLRIGTLAPKSSLYHRPIDGGRRGLARRRRAVGAKYLVYPDGSQGGETDMARRMRIGQLQGALLSVVGLREIEPSIAALQNMPLLFRSWEEVDYVREKMRPGMEKKWGFGISGGRRTGNSRPDRSPFGFSGVRRRSFELACRVLIPQTSTALMRCRIALACNIRRY